LAIDLPFCIGPALPPDVFATVRRRAIFDCCKWDPQHEDRSVLAPFPLILRESAWNELQKLAESLYAEAIAAEQELVHGPDLHRELGLPRCIRKVLARSPSNGRTAGVRVMRFDFHFTTEGWRISEVNSDVPGGFVEAGGFTRLMASHFPGLLLPEDPAQVYARCLREASGPDASVAFIHATAHSDDRQVMEYLGRVCLGLGMKPVMASPAHLVWNDGRAQVDSSFYRGTLDALVRFFPAEWLPNLRHALLWQPWFQASRTVMSNPGTALLIQSKRFPLAWNRMSVPVPTWRRLLPQTQSPGAISARALSDYVLKPTWGRVGEDVVVPGVTGEKLAKHCRRSARWFPAAWVAQQPFQAVPAMQDASRLYPCFGVFCIEGRASGLYGRIASKPLIDHSAQDVAVLIEPEKKEHP
jgi:glutathionylspermidine synthase